MGTRDAFVFCVHKINFHLSVKLLIMLKVERYLWLYLRFGVEFVILFYDAIDLNILMVSTASLRLIKLESMLTVIFLSGTDCFHDYTHLFFSL